MLLRSYEFRENRCSESRADVSELNFAFVFNIFVRLGEKFGMEDVHVMLLSN